MTARFLALSDAHFNPFKNLTKQVFDQLVAQPASAWGAILGGLDLPVATPGEDADYRLLHESLTQAAKVAGSVDFILYPGDFMCHNWWSLYQQIAGGDRCASWEAFRSFTEKAIELFKVEMAAAFPGAVVLPTVGNDDSFCEDYWLQAKGAFLESFAGLWAPQLPAGAETGSFASLGCYTADLPQMPHHRLVVLNNIPWSAGYCSPKHTPAGTCSGCSPSGWAPGSSPPEKSSPGDAVMGWLGSALRKAKADGKIVWLMMHIPPGLDSYRENQAYDPSRPIATKITTLWAAGRIDAFHSAIEASGARVQISFTGHTHMDDFRFGTPGGGSLMHKIIPGVSPIFGNNPAFQVYEHDRQTGAISDWHTYFYDMDHSIWSDYPYSAKGCYGSTDPLELRALFEKMVSPDAAVRHSAASQTHAYQGNYWVRRDCIRPSHVPVYACADLHEDAVSFKACLERAAPKHMHRVLELDPTLFRHLVAERI